MVDKISTRNDSGVSSASIMLGGIRLFGKSEEQLLLSIDAIRKRAISELAQARWTMRRYLRASVMDGSEADKPDRVFSAVFGRILALGEACVLECLSSNRAYYQAFYAPSRAEELNASLQLLVSSALRNKVVAISAVRDQIFPDGQKGAWPKTSLLVDVLHHSGHLSWEDQYSFKKSEGLEYAIRTLRARDLNVNGYRLAVS